MCFPDGLPSGVHWEMRSSRLLITDGDPSRLQKDVETSEYDLRQCEYSMVKEDQTMPKAGTRPTLVCSALTICLLASCSGGPCVPKYLLGFTEVDDIAPDIGKVKVTKVRVDSLFAGLEEPERERISGKIRELAEEALGEAGYEVVSNGADAELDVTYSEVIKTHYVRGPFGGSQTPRQSNYVEMSIALIDRERTEVLYRRFDLTLPRPVREGQCAFDMLRKEIRERFRRFLGSNQWY